MVWTDLLHITLFFFQDLLQKVLAFQLELQELVAYEDTHVSPHFYIGFLALMQYKIMFATDENIT